MNDFTINLTPTEIAFKRTIRPMNELQRVTLETALRTGKRIGTSVGQVRGAPKNAAGKPYNVNLVAYRLNKKGEPTGGSKVTELATGLSAAEAADYIAAWKA